MIHTIRTAFSGVTRNTDKRHNAVRWNNRRSGLGGLMSKCAIRNPKPTYTGPGPSQRASRPVFTDTWLPVGNRPACDRPGQTPTAGTGTLADVQTRRIARQQGCTPGQRPWKPLRLNPYSRAREGVSINALASRRSIRARAQSNQNPCTGVPRPKPLLDLLRTVSRLVANSDRASSARPN